MTNDALSVLVCLFSNIWRLFNSWCIPGTNVTPAESAFGILFTVMMFNFIGKALGLFAEAGPGNPPAEKPPMPPMSNVPRLPGGKRK
mgnify:CR=1 FL=1